jgi:hypothetical protein
VPGASGRERRADERPGGREELLARVSCSTNCEFVPGAPTAGGPARIRNRRRQPSILVLIPFILRSANALRQPNINLSCEASWRGLCLRAKRAST